MQLSKYFDSLARLNAVPPLTSSEIAKIVSKLTLLMSMPLDSSIKFLKDEDHMPEDVSNKIYKRKALIASNNATKNVDQSGENGSSGLSNFPQSDSSEEKLKILIKISQSVEQFINDIDIQIFYASRDRSEIVKKSANSDGSIRNDPFTSNEEEAILQILAFFELGKEIATNCEVVGNKALEHLKLIWEDKTERIREHLEKVVGKRIRDAKIRSFYFETLDKFFFGMTLFTLLAEKNACRELKLNGSC